MNKVSVAIKKRLLLFLCCYFAVFIMLIFRVIYLQTIKAEELQKLAYEQQTRDRLISAQRGDILDVNGVPLATTESVSAVSVINAQLESEEEAAKYLSEKLNLDYDEVLKKVSEKVALVRIATKVDKETAIEIMEEQIAGVVVDEDIKRVYPYSSLAAQVLGFVGKDNQGIIGLEAKYDEYLEGEQGKILTITDNRGVEISDYQRRIEPTNGGNLVTTIDVVIQQYAEQTIEKAVIAKEAKNGIIIVLNPQNGEIYAMANYPNFDLNDPFTINDELLLETWGSFSEEEKNNMLNQMWRNTAINDTYEPGSTFKIVTSAAGLEAGVISENTTFTCSGSHVVGDRVIKCWRYPNSHGLQTFVEGVTNSCNPVFMVIAEKLGVEIFYDYLYKFGFHEKTGIDLPGEAVGIIHKEENVGPVELATMSFGQSFQITPLQLLKASSAVVNGGYSITPHFVKEVINENGEVVESFNYEKGEQILSEETSAILKNALEEVVSNGTGNKTYIPGYSIGGKTATSEKLPRKNGKYIASFMTFAPSDNPTVMALVLIDEPQGVYYGGSVAGPVMKELLSNVLPYLGIEPNYSEEEMELLEVIETPNFIGLSTEEAKKVAFDNGLNIEFKNDNQIITSQFPNYGEVVNKGSKIFLNGE